MPLVFMPDWLQKIVLWLPFKYLYAVPIGIIQNTYRWSTIDVFYLSLVFLVMTMVTNWLWRKAMYQYTSAGG